MVYVNRYRLCNNSILRLPHAPRKPTGRCMSNSTCEKIVRSILLFLYLSTQLVNDLKIVKRTIDGYAKLHEGEHLIREMSSKQLFDSSAPCLI